LTHRNGSENIEEIYMVTDFEGGLIIGGYNYDYPILVYDISRSDINYDRKKVLDLQKTYTETQETISPQAGKRRCAMLHSVCLPVAVSTFVVKFGNSNCR
jgi:hypothetical protein